MNSQVVIVHTLGFVNIIIIAFRITICCSTQHKLLALGLTCPLPWQEWLHAPCQPKLT
jgi:hypothetical protein